ncbi:hypothetical protein AAC387_Pa12g2319 [Persea americana]
MLRRKFSLLLLQRVSPSSYPLRFSSTSSSSDAGKSTKSFSRKAISVVLISLTGGVALSALEDLAIYHGCSTKAIEKASENRAIVEALGEPIVRGPWYSASLAVAHKRHSVSCTFPVSGPQGTGIFQLKAIRQGDDSWFSFLRHQDWDILIMEALLHVPTNEDKHQTFRISLTGNTAPPASTECKDCRHQESESPEKK